MIEKENLEILVAWKLYMTMGVLTAFTSLDKYTYML